MGFRFSGVARIYGNSVKTTSVSPVFTKISNDDHDQRLSTDATPPLIYSTYFLTTTHVVLFALLFLPRRIQLPLLTKGDIIYIIGDLSFALTDDPGCDYRLAIEATKAWQVNATNDEVSAPLSITAVSLCRPVYVSENENHYYLFVMNKCLYSGKYIKMAVMCKDYRRSIQEVIANVNDPSAIVSIEGVFKSLTFNGVAELIVQSILFNVVPVESSHTGTQPPAPWYPTISYKDFIESRRQSVTQQIHDGYNMNLLDDGDSRIPSGSNVLLPQVQSGPNVPSYQPPSGPNVPPYQPPSGPNVPPYQPPSGPNVLSHTNFPVANSNHGLLQNQTYAPAPMYLEHPSSFVKQISQTAQVESGEYVRMAPHSRVPSDWVDFRQEMTRRSNNNNHGQSSTNVNRSYPTVNAVLPTSGGGGGNTYAQFPMQSTSQGAPANTMSYPIMQPTTYTTPANPSYGGNNGAPNDAFYGVQTYANGFSGMVRDQGAMFAAPAMPMMQNQAHGSANHTPVSFVDVNDETTFRSTILSQVAPNNANTNMYQYGPGAQ